MGRYFGTDGFRGEVNVALTAGHAYKIGCFIGARLRETAQSADGVAAAAVIGRDTRLSGGMLEYALTAGLNSYGANALRMGVVPTPAVAFAVKKFGLSCGIMISASHNPYYDNGIKLFGENGEKLSERTIATIEDFIDGKVSCPDKPAAKSGIGGSSAFKKGRREYEKFLLSNGVNLSGLKVGLDCANGSAYKLAKYVFSALGATVTAVNVTPDGLNINANCGSTHTDGLRKLVREKGLDIGFAYDGDADRCLAVDECGNLVNGDKILFICGKYLKSRGELDGNTVATTVMSNLGLYKAFDREGINYVQTAVGDKYVREYMLENRCALGGEQSGHIIFSRCASTGDGILTSLKIAETVVANKAKLSELALPVTDYPQALLNVRVNDKRAVLEDENVKKAVRSAEQKLGGRGRILVRESGTEPLIRVMVEAESGTECKTLAENVIAAVREGGYERKD